MKYIILQNTLAPYRISLFNKLREMGLDIELLYMAEMERYRSWKIDYGTIHYPYEIDKKGFKGSIKGFDLYWNWKFLKRFCHEKDAKIILGGSWNFPDIIVACVLKRLGFIKCELLFWSEANYLTIGSRKKNKLRDWLRSFVYNTGNARVIVPGQRAIESFDKWGLKKNSFILLPNVIEEEKFRPLISDLRTYTSIEEQPHFVLSVRLDEAIKGIINFFKAIGGDNIRKAQFHVLGDGPDEQMIKQFVIDNDYSDNIHFSGFCTMDQMAEYYMKSDCLILPSFSDPSPLSLVEACCCSMPMLVSTRCGNHYETVENGRNGYTFDPDNHSEIKQAFENLLARRSEWNEMGKVSRFLFEKNFKQDVVLKHFVQFLKNTE